MKLNIQWLEKNIKHEFKDSDIYTILDLYMGMIKICKQADQEKSA